jgi:hypothetical protein
MLDAAAIRAALPDALSDLALEPEEARDLLQRVEAALAGSGGRRRPPNGKPRRVPRKRKRADRA